MPKDSGLLSMGSFVIVFTWSFLININYTLTSHEGQSKNNPPVVRIVTPKNNSAHEWNSLVRYSINVSDAEDGESRYEEIPPNEVFLEVRYVADTSLSVYRNPGNNSPPGLEQMKRSGCFICHAVKSKTIGPSFEEIARRYSNTPATKEMVAKRITGGSTGVWGKAIMPSNPELPPDDARQMLEWILNKSADPDLNYFTGVTGTIRIVPPASGPAGAYLITATYTDHGLKDKPKQNQKGRDVIIIRGK